MSALQFHVQVAAQFELAITVLRLRELQPHRKPVVAFGIVLKLGHDLSLAVRNRTVWPAISGDSSTPLAQCGQLMILITSFRYAGKCLHSPCLNSSTDSVSFVSLSCDNRWQMNCVKTKFIGRGYFESECVECGAMMLWLAGDEMVCDLSDDGELGYLCGACAGPIAMATPLDDE